MQTIALCRLLGGTAYGVYRDSPLPPENQHLPLIAAGWLGYAPLAARSDSLFAGIHIARNEHHYIQAIRESSAPAGARDPYTAQLFRMAGVDFEMIGCATLTFARYAGPRRSVYTIDSPPRTSAISVTNHIGDLSWEEQWNLAIERLNQIRTAEMVYTSRLHVILPCLAFGTPVMLTLQDYSKIEDKNRLTILAELGFRFDQPNTLDASGMAARFRRFLKRNLNRTLTPCERPAMPVLLNDL